MVGPGGLEPPTPALSTRCSNQLSYEPKFKKEFNWWSRSGSNRRPPQCHCGALPTELRPRKVFSIEKDCPLVEIKRTVGSFARWVFTQGRAGELKPLGF